MAAPVSGGISQTQAPLVSYLSEPANERLGSRRRADTDTPKLKGKTRLDQQYLLFPGPTVLSSSFSVCWECPFLQEALLACSAPRLGSFFLGECWTLGLRVPCLSAGQFKQVGLGPGLSFHPHPALLIPTPLSPPPCPPRIPWPGPVLTPLSVQWPSLEPVTAVLSLVSGSPGLPLAPATAPCMR